MLRIVSMNDVRDSTEKALLPRLLELDSEHSKSRSADCTTKSFLSASTAQEISPDAADFTLRLEVFMHQRYR